MLYDLSNSYELNKAATYFEHLKRQGARIEIKKKRRGRTLKQNSYLHVLFGLFGNETGYTIEEAKEVVKRLLGYTYIKGRHTFTKSTSNFSTSEMTTFVDKFREFAREQGIYLPLPNEITDELLNQLEQNKYL